MQALILAAGMGSRLGKYTKQNTKCMLEINGITLIEHTLNKLDTLGVKKLILVVGYKRENLQKFLGNKYRNIDITYVINPIYNKTNNIYSLFLAKDYLVEDDTLLLESDIIFDEQIILKLLKDNRKSLAVVDKYQSWMDGTVVKLDNNDRIISFIPKKFFNFNEINDYYKTVNIYKFSKEFSISTYVPFLEAYSKALGNNEYYEQVLRVITKLENQELKALRLSGEKWYEIDDIQDKNNAEAIFAINSKEKLNLFQKRYGGYWRFPGIKDFCYLVNPYFPSEIMINEMKAYFSDLLTQYPSGLDTQNLLAGKMFTVDDSMIAVGNGAAELIRSLVKNIKGTIGVVFPTFNEYPESIGYKRVVKFIPKNPDFSYSITDLIGLAERSDHLLLINPDNPSGNFLFKSDIITILEKFKDTNKLIILDESFIDFANHGRDHSMLEMDILKKYHNLIIIKSISKSYGVPGIRLGILVSANKRLVNRVKKEIPIWNINSYGEFFLQIIGKYQKDYDEGCREIIEERNRFFHKLNKINFLRVIPSEANYFLCEVTQKYSATELTRLLLFKHNIFIKDLTGKIGIKNNYVRIAIKSTADNDELIRNLKTL